MRRERRDGRALVAHAVERRARPASPASPSRRAGDQPVDERDGCERRAEPLGDELQVEQRCPATPDDRSAPIAGPPSAPNALPERGVESAGLLGARTTVGGHSLAKKVPNASTSCSCSSLSERSTAHGRARRRRERRRHALPPADHRPVGVVDDLVGLDLVVGHAFEHRRDHLRERDPRQVRARAPVDADAERHVAVRVAVDHERVGVGELRVVASGRHLAQQHRVALLHR